MTDALTPPVTPAMIEAAPLAQIRAIVERTNAKLHADGRMDLGCLGMKGDAYDAIAALSHAEAGLVERSKERIVNVLLCVVEAWENKTPIDGFLAQEARECADILSDAEAGAGRPDEVESLAQCFAGWHVVAVVGVYGCYTGICTPYAGRR